MFRFLLTGLLGIAVTSGILPGAARAGEVIYSFSGVIGSDGLDENGIFASAGSSLAGQAFTAVYQWSPAVRPASLVRAPYLQGVLAGPAFGTAQAISGTLSINGQSFQFGAESGLLQRANGAGSPSSGSGFDVIGGQVIGSDPNLGLATLTTFARPVAGVDILADADLTAPIATTLLTPTSGGSFAIDRPDGANGSLRSGGTLLVSSFSVATTGVIAVADVPEPASWALLIVGFGLVGGTLRVSRSARYRQTAPGMA